MPLPQSLRTPLVLVCALTLGFGATLPVVVAQGAAAPPPAAPASPGEQPPAEEVTPDSWPKTATVGELEYELYQPQLDSWDGFSLEAHAAVSVATVPPGPKGPVFGIIGITANTHVERQLQTVHFTAIKVVNAKFPTVPDKAETYRKAIETILQDGPATMPLARLQAALALQGAEKRAAEIPVKNEPPAFVFSPKPAVLVSIDGAPVWRPVQGTDFERVFNTRPLILKTESGTLYLHVLDGFVQAGELNGPWTVAPAPPAGAASLAAKLAKDGVVDPMTGEADPKTKKMPSLKNGAPGIVVATTPTELVVTQGPPDWAPIEGTTLLYAKNTTANLFKDVSSQQTFILVTGRWFSAPSLQGPWIYLSPKALPSEFAKIPTDSPKENVLASVSGTPQAQEAVIADQIPQMAQINPNRVNFSPHVDGEPVLEPIPETSLKYVANSAVPILKVDDMTWYACQNGVWFLAASFQGPWIAATKVPAAIYAIPPSSPLYYVTFVKIYQVTPTYIEEGYTPGYMGTVVAPGGVVVYGTGYVYAPYISATVWVPPPVTYGYAASMAWTPWTGWAFGFGFGWAMGAATAAWCWGAAPYWGAYGYAYHGYGYGAYGGAAAWGPNGWAATSANTYSHWGASSMSSHYTEGYNAWTGNGWSGQVSHSYNSVTGRASAGYSGAVGNAYTGNYAYGNAGKSYNPNTGVTTRAGNVDVGNAYNGSENNVKYATATGPGGQTAGVAQKGDNTYAGKDGNVYKYNSSTGNLKQYDGNGNWSTVQKPTASQTSEAQSHAQERNMGAQRSASSSWGGNWGGGFDKGGGGGGGGGNKSWGGGGGGAESRGGGGGNRSWGGGGGGGRSWGGGGWGGGGGRWGGGGGGGGRWGGGGGFGGFHGGGRR
jgi:hypothetical protein